MRRVAAAIVLAGLLTVGCQQTTPGVKIADPQTSSGTFTESDVKLSNGRTVHCLFWATGSDHSQIGGMSCDWPH